MMRLRGDIMQNEPIRVLMVIGCMGMGGAEAMIMNIYRCIDRQKVQFDFLVHKNRHGDYEEEITSLGGRIYRIDKYLVKNYFSYVRQLKMHFSAHPEHKIVHCHIGSSAPVCLRIAKRFGAYTIAHSHSTRDTIRDIHSRLWFINSFFTRFIADHFFACSKEAAIDRFGKRVAESDRCEVIYNGIDCGRFSFNQVNRENIRKKYGLEKNFVVGNVGRHTPPKNPLFMLQVFAEVYKKDSNARLLQVGQGELTEQMRTESRRLGIENAVIFAGAHLDVEKYYSAMDVFLFPSLWEGLGMVAVEAQTNGLHSIVSDAIPILADIGAGLYHSVSLSKGAEEWAEEVLKFRCVRPAEDALSFRDTQCAEDAKAHAIKAGYDVRHIAKNLANFYLQENQK